MTTTPPPAAERPRTTFKIPKGARIVAGDPQSVTFEPLTARAELDAARAAITRGGGTDAALTHELVRRSIVAVDGRPVDWADGSRGVGPEWLDATSPQCRGLLSAGFIRVNRATKQDEDDFLASADLTVG